MTHKSQFITALIQEQCQIWKKIDKVNIEDDDITELLAAHAEEEISLQYSITKLFKHY